MATLNNWLLSVFKAAKKMAGTKSPEAVFKSVKTPVSVFKSGCG